MISSDRVEGKSTTKRTAQQLKDSRAAKESWKHPAAIRSSPAPSAQEYVNPELGSSVIRGHAAPSKDFLPTDLRTTKNLPLLAKENFPFE